MDVFVVVSSNLYTIQLMIRDSGVKAIENLVKKKKNFDCVLLETTGLADPAPIASMFWLDDALQSELYLDGIVTGNLIFTYAFQWLMPSLSLSISIKSKMTVLSMKRPSKIYNQYFTLGKLHWQIG